jgi:hypothetical protein
MNDYLKQSETTNEEWDRLINGQKSIDWLDREISEVVKEIDSGKSLDCDPSLLEM